MDDQERCIRNCPYGRSDALKRQDDGRFGMSVLISGRSFTVAIPSAESALIEHRRHPRSFAPLGN
jgi:hypothetical protein